MSNSNGTTSHVIVYATLLMNVRFCFFSYENNISLTCIAQDFGIYTRPCYNCHYIMLLSIDFNVLMTFYHYQMCCHVINIILHSSSFHMKFMTLSKAYLISFCGKCSKFSNISCLPNSAFPEQTASEKAI